VGLALVASVKNVEAMQDAPRQALIMEIAGFF